MVKSEKSRTFMKKTAGWWLSQATIRIFKADRVLMANHEKLGYLTFRHETGYLVLSTLDEREVAYLALSEAQDIRLKNLLASLDVS